MLDLVEPHAIRRGARRLGLAALLALGLGGSTAHARPSLDGPRMTQLGHYEVLTFSDPFQGGIDRGKAIGVIDATPEEVFRVATDFARYHEYMPRIEGAQQISRNDESARVVLTAELPWPAGRTWIEALYHFERAGSEIYRVRFDMARGNMRRYVGSLYIEPWSRTQTAITYELVAEPDIVAPKGVINKGVRRSAGKFIHALRQRINEMHRLGLLHPVLPPVAVAPTALVRPNPATLKARR
jgi:ribosome-associated toxin RatA of RatAB toxin-antitoxin module